MKKTHKHWENIYGYHIMALKETIELTKKEFLKYSIERTRVYTDNIFIIKHKTDYYILSLNANINTNEYRFDFVNNCIIIVDESNHDTINKDWENYPLIAISTNETIKSAAYISKKTHIIYNKYEYSFTKLFNQLAKNKITYTEEEILRVISPVTPLNRSQFESGEAIKKMIKDNLKKYYRKDICHKLTTCMYTSSENILFLSIK